MTRETFLPFAPPVIGDEEVVEIVAALRSGWITTGPRSHAFEDRFAKLVNAPAALAVNSCTAAIHLALTTMGIGPGDLVLTSPLTFCSTVHCIEHVGATPVLVDVDPDTLNLDPGRVEETLNAITKGEPGLVPGLAADHVPPDAQPRALLPVHFAGQPCNMRELMSIAGRYSLAVVEDAAHALGAAFAGSPVGTVSAPDGVPARAVCFSFYATKNITTAEGGMLTGSPELVDDARVFSLHGMTRDAWTRAEDPEAGYYDVVRPGFKYNMPDVLAALGMAQLTKLSAFQARRSEIARRYSEALAEVPEVIPPAVDPEVDHAWHLYVTRIRPGALAITRREFITELAGENIGASIHFRPVHLLSYYRDRYGFNTGDFTVAESAYESSVSLPIYPSMTDQDVEDVIKAVREVVRRSRRL